MEMKYFHPRTMGGVMSNFQQGQQSQDPQEGAGPIYEGVVHQSVCEDETARWDAEHTDGSGLINSASDSSKTKVTDLDLDSLILCSSNLSLHDLANMAMTCQHFRDAAYSDTVWEIQCRNRWPPKQLCYGNVFQYIGGRDAYVARHTATQQLRYTDPMDVHLHLLPMPVNHLLIDDDTVTIAQGPIITVWKVKPSESGHLEAPNVSQALRDHNARVTCMRLLPVGVLGAMRNFLGGVKNILVTSSGDHTIRLWGKGRSLRTLRGHQGPVSTLADQLVGKESSPQVLASGGTDGTVRLWSLSSSSSSRGRSPLLATLHGLEPSIKELAVAGHNPSLLISAAKDAKLRVWDVMATSSAAGVGTCVGTTKGTFEGMPVGLKSIGPICYIGGGSTVKAIDLRTMYTVATVSLHEPGVLTFAVSPSGTGICTGGLDKTAKLWDLRMIGDTPKTWAVLGNHAGPVHNLHYDSYKVITGGTADRHVHVWNADTAKEISALDSTITSSSSIDIGVSAFVASGGKLVTGTCGEDPGFVRLQDFTNCVNPLVDFRADDSLEHQNSSKFWDNTPSDSP